MAAIALSVTWAGGWIFALFWTMAALLALREWLGIVTGGQPLAALAAGALAIVLGALAAAGGNAALAAVALLAGVAAARVALGMQSQAGLASAGVAYAGAMAGPIIVLRLDPSLGTSAVLFVFAVVWGSDIMAYFTGRSIGGPKLWPRISPKKTWSGFVGGTLSGALAGMLVGIGAGLGASAALFGLGLVLAIVSQGGDLFESAIKRRFGAKDAGHLIPGHGGVMDRLDGFVAAALVALLIGLLGDPANPAAGLLMFH